MTDTLHGNAVVVDSHNDLLLLVARRPRNEQAAYFRAQWLPQLRAGGVDVQVLPVCCDSMSEVLGVIEAGHRVAEGNSDEVALCYAAADIDAALAGGKIALILALESCVALGSEVGLLETMFKLGVRMASFTHYYRTALADGSAEDATGSRLTRAGAEALTLMEELGMLMDVSHLSAAGVDDVLERATRPVVASHSSAFSVLQHHRNLTDDRLTGIAATGGVVGVCFLARMVAGPTSPTVEHLVDHITHVASTAGTAHVGLGPDFLKEFYEETLVGDPVIDGLRPKHQIPNLGGPTGLPLVTKALLERDVSEEDIRAILGENWLRVLRAEMGIAASARQRSEAMSTAVS